MTRGKRTSSSKASISATTPTKMRRTQEPGSSKNQLPKTTPVKPLPSSTYIPRRDQIDDDDDFVGKAYFDSSICGDHRESNPSKSKGANERNIEIPPVKTPRANSKSKPAKRSSDSTSNKTRKLETERIDKIFAQTKFTDEYLRRVRTKEKTIKSIYDILHNYECEYCAEDNVQHSSPSLLRFRLHLGDKHDGQTLKRFPSNQRSWTMDEVIADGNAASKLSYPIWKRQLEKGEFTHQNVTEMCTAQGETALDNVLYPFYCHICDKFNQARKEVLYRSLTGHMRKLHNNPADLSDDDEDKVYPSRWARNIKPKPVIKPIILEDYDPKELEGLSEREIFQRRNEYRDRIYKSHVSLLEDGQLSCNACLHTERAKYMINHMLVHLPVELLNAHGRVVAGLEPKPGLADPRIITREITAYMRESGYSASSYPSECGGIKFASYGRYRKHVKYYHIKSKPTSYRLANSPLVRTCIKRETVKVGESIDSAQCNEFVSHLKAYVQEQHKSREANRDVYIIIMVKSDIEIDESNLEFYLKNPTAGTEFVIYAGKSSERSSHSAVYHFNKDQRRCSTVAKHEDKGYKCFLLWWFHITKSEARTTMEIQEQLEAYLQFFIWLSCKHENNKHMRFVQQMEWTTLINNYNHEQLLKLAHLVKLRNGRLFKFSGDIVTSDEALPDFGEIEIKQNDIRRKSYQLRALHGEAENNSDDDDSDEDQYSEDEDDTSDSEEKLVAEGGQRKKIPIATEKVQHISDISNLDFNPMEEKHIVKLIELIKPYYKPSKNKAGWIYIVVFVDNTPDTNTPAKFANFLRTAQKGKKKVKIDYYVGATVDPRASTLKIAPYHYDPQTISSSIRSRTERGQLAYFLSGSEVPISQVLKIESFFQGCAFLRLQLKTEQRPSLFFDIVNTKVEICNISRFFKDEDYERLYRVGVLETELFCLNQDCKNDHDVFGNNVCPCGIIHVDFDKIIGLDLREVIKI